jgi:SAM-dependent methyltransferase
MSEPPSSFNIRTAWNQTAAAYQARLGQSLAGVTYGALAPAESELNLLGELRGRRVLDLGCGGGQNAVACARAGALVTGIDLSASQLAYAHALAAEQRLAIRFVEGDAADLAALLAPGFDLILTVQALQYVDNLPRTLTACREMLEPGGRLVVSLDHPIRDCFFDQEEDELAGYPVRSYFDPSPLCWSFDAAHPMQSHHRTVAGWLLSLHEAGFALRGLFEPPVPPDLLNELWPDDSPLAPLRALPHTLILDAVPAQN